MVAGWGRYSQYKVRHSIDPPESDEDDQSRARLGLHHRTGLLAFQIIADNTFQAGRLYFDRLGQRPVEHQVPLNAVLVPGEYFFIVNLDPAYRYPIVPSFRDWRSPHGHMPDGWPSPESNPSTDAAHSRCVVTNHRFGLTNAHLIPAEEAEWFMWNNMSRYGVAMRDVHDSQNIICLRADIHRCFDTAASTPASAVTPSSFDPPSYVVHVVGLKSGEFPTLYHNTLLQNLEDTSREYMLARFAWTVLLLVKPFVLTGSSRSGGGLDWDVEEVPGPKLLGLYGGGGTRSASPKKRSRQHEDAELTRLDDADDADEWYKAVFDEPRGRKRRRLGSSGSPDSHRTPQRCSFDDILHVPSLSQPSSFTAPSSRTTCRPSPSPLECLLKHVENGKAMAETAADLT
ncbi:hypothetical protein ColTof4_13611 [Colletotrichum tofieldiae]|nr:hypothetical protein ColTof3_14563 [Colletotrichum tofieldiae]GKT81188.1 hypothetical protein ColTof4_13611 [Colletotrichum tofieldiae]